MGPNGTCEHEAAEVFAVRTASASPLAVGRGLHRMAVEAVVDRRPSVEQGHFHFRDDLSERTSLIMHDSMQVTPLTAWNHTLWEDIL